MIKRFFVSVDLPPEIKDYLRTIQNSEIRWVKWMKPGNLHVTLNFLGNLTDNEMETAKSILKKVSARHGSLQISLDRAHAERDMLWLMLAENPKLVKLQDELKRDFREARIGKRERRPYVPHILLAKSKTGRSMTWFPPGFKPLKLEGKSISLYQSELTPGSATHLLLESYQLNFDHHNEN